jgi:hypothetical protein
MAELSFLFLVFLLPGNINFIKEFSPCRNLICVYSKKHMNDFPELVDMKRRANTRSLKEMALLLRYSSLIVTC